MNNESQKVISRVLLMSGGMYDTKMTREEYEKARYDREEWEKIEIPGVFGEVLVTHAGALLGFIDRTSLDVEAARAAQQRMQQRSPLLS